MSDTNDQTLDQAVDPPDNNGGTGKAAFDLTSGSGTQPQPVDPPDNNGGTGTTTS